MRFHPLLLFCAPASAAAPNKFEAAKEESKAVAEAATDADDAALTVGERDFCEGKQVTYADCNVKQCKGCEPIDCALGDWNAWSACLCEGLQERNRVIVKHNNECGIPCEDALIQTQNCDIECLKEPVNCALKEWGDWVGCDTGNAYQKERTRAYEEPENGGEGCNATTREVQPCPNPPAPQDQDCVWGDWSDWSACTSTCDGGQKTRDRSVITAPRGMGKHCEKLFKD